MWNSSLSEENIEDLERVQKAAVRVMLGQKYTNYEDGLEKLNLIKLSDIQTCNPTRDIVTN